MNDRLLAETYLAPHTATVCGNLLLCDVPAERLVTLVTALYHRHRLPLKTITAFDERAEPGAFRVMYVFTVPGENAFLAPFVRVTDSFPSLTPAIHEAAMYERKIRSFFGLEPFGHPAPRSLILHDENWPAGVFPLRKDVPWNARPAPAAAVFPFRELGGEGIYEIPVGPVHAGIIEPGHFRFSVGGEEILMLEPRLGYSHKGAEKLFEVLPLADKVRLAERVSGDSSFSHALAFCQALEQLGGLHISARDAYLRVIFAELERLANHFGDCGAIMTDAGFNFGGANGSRLRESILQIHERLTGSRFLRGVLQPGGLAVDLSAEQASSVARELETIGVDFAEVIAVADNSSTLQNRLQNTGTLEREIAADHGVVGVAGRAVGFAIDARKDAPYAAYDRLTFEIATAQSGDVEARFRVRVAEVASSLSLLHQALTALPPDAPRPTLARLTPNSFALGIVEGWRGEIVYLVATDAQGDIRRVDVRDPSFLNWTVLGHAGRGNVVPDFPLINKSFNLSYSGHDL